MHGDAALPSPPNAASRSKGAIVSTRHVRRLARVLIAVAVAVTGLTVTAAPAGAATQRRYIVVLGDTADSGAGAAAPPRRYGAHVSCIYHRAVHGYAATMTAAKARALAHEPGVESVEPDRRVRV